MSAPANPRRGWRGWHSRAATPWPQPDFLPRRQRSARLAWALLGCGVLVFAVAANEWRGVRAAQAEASLQLQRWQRAARPALAPVATPVVTPVATLRSGDAAGRASADAAQALARRLEHPWQALFEATERAAPSGLHWLRMEHDSERGDLRLEGIAPNRDSLLVTLEALVANSNWHDVMLLRVEAGEGVAAGGVRFEMRARHGVAAVQVPAQ